MSHQIAVASSGTRGRSLWESNRDPFAWQASMTRSGGWATMQAIWTRGRRRCTAAPPSATSLTPLGTTPTSPYFSLSMESMRTMTSAVRARDRRALLTDRRSAAALRRARARWRERARAPEHGTIAALHPRPPPRRATPCRTVRPLPPSHAWLWGTRLGRLEQHNAMLQHVRRRVGVSRGSDLAGDLRSQSHARDHPLRVGRPRVRGGSARRRGLRDDRRVSDELDR